MTNCDWMETQNLVISFDYSWFLAKNLAYAECPIMKFHYRNSSTHHHQKVEKLKSRALWQKKYCYYVKNFANEHLHPGLEFINCLLEMRANDFTKRMYFLKRNSVISTHRGFHCLLKFCYPYCHWYLGIHMKKLQLYALSRPKANLDTICHFLRFKTREFCLLPDANCKFETCSVPGYLLLFYL